MKYWIFYDKRHNDEIYAYTSDKELSKLFKKYRNTDILECSKVNLEYEDDDLIMLKEDYAHSLIIKEHLTTYDVESNKWKYVQFPMTISEKLTIDSIIQRGVIDLQVNAGYNPIIFNDDIRKALNIIKYSEYYFANNNTNYIPKQPKEDMLKLFLYHFEETIS